LERREILPHQPDKMRRNQHRPDECRRPGRDGAEIDPSPRVGGRGNHEREHEENRPVFGEDGSRGGNPRQRGVAQMTAPERQHEGPGHQCPQWYQDGILIEFEAKKIIEGNKREQEWRDGELRVFKPETRQQK
jgi:hypothetical protein